MLAQIGPDVFAPRLGSGGFIVIGAQPADTSFRLSVDRRVPVELSSSSGDQESPALYRATCPARERGPKYTCFEFIVYMRSGVSVRTIRDRVEGMGGRLASVSPLESWANVIVFDLVNMIARSRAALDWPGVEAVATEVAFCVGATTACSLSNLAIAVAVDTGSARPFDGVLQVGSLDTVSIRYRQPGRALLETRLFVP